MDCEDDDYMEDVVTEAPSKMEDANARDAANVQAGDHPGDQEVQLSTPYLT